MLSQQGDGLAGGDTMLLVSQSLARRSRHFANSVKCNYTAKSCFLFNSPCCTKFLQFKLLKRQGIHTRVQWQCVHVYSKALDSGFRRKTLLVNFTCTIYSQWQRFLSLLWAQALVCSCSRVGEADKWWPH